MSRHGSVGYCLHMSVHFEHVTFFSQLKKFLQSGGLVFCSCYFDPGTTCSNRIQVTIPIAMFSERYDSRRMPLIVGLVALLVSQIMLMESPVYWLMCLARVLQGISSSVVWVVGLALLCVTDSCCEHVFSKADNDSIQC
jgi:MFS family permease